MQPLTEPKDKRKIQGTFKRLKALDPVTAAALNKKSQTVGVTFHEIKEALQRAEAALMQAGGDSWGLELKRGGYGRMPQIQRILPFMSGPCAKAYILLVLRCSSKTGIVTIGAREVSRKISGRGPTAGGSREHGSRVLRKLVDAGLIVRLRKGCPGQCSTYRLVAARQIDLERAQRILPQPMTRKAGLTSAP